MKNKSLSKAKVIFALLVLVLTLKVNANPVDVEKARQVAKTFLNNNGAQSTGLRDVSAEADFSNVYVFTTENSFVLIAADDCSQPVLGYSLTSRFDVENMPENKASWIQKYDEGIHYAIEHQLRASSEILQEWNDLASGNPNTGRATTVVAPLLHTQWSQNSPFNMLCPSNCVTGCVATAMAQVMKYWNYPQHGIGWHSYVHSTYGELTADFQSTNYDWSNMTNTYSNSSTYAQKLAVATLMYHCGVSVEMNYSLNASGAVTAHVPNALISYFNYSSDAHYLSRSAYSDSEWITMLKADLDQSRPIQYDGSGSGGGHSFVCDGYNSNNYFHFNWGWAGYCDEYYSINNLAPGPNGPGSGSTGVYNDNQGAVFGVHPSDCTANAPTNLNYTQNGRNVTLTWSSASGAVSYNIYRNTYYLGNVSSTTYSDIASYGNSVYYVRSVDSNGRQSLSSNAVTVTVPFQTPVVDDLTASVSGNNVHLAWTAPEWCYPQTPTATLSYGDGTPYYYWTSVYYAHRHLASSLAQYAGKAVYKISTYIQYPGTYSLYIYTKSTSNNQPNPNYLAFNVNGRIITNSNVWYEFDLDNPIILTGTDDLWVVMKQENTGQTYPVPSFQLSSHNINAFYAGNSPTNLYDANSNYNCAWYINTYVTDGTYTYNIFRNGTSIANNVSATSYNDNNLSPGSYNYYVKTNYYGGQTGASNQVTVQVGNVTYYNISVSANPTSGGTVTGGGSYQQGASCTVSATPATGYTFTNWTENGTQVSTNANYTFTVNANRNLVANFTLNTYTITASASPANGGTVSGGGTYNHGQSCTLHATAATGYNFVNWTENGTQVSTNADYTFTVTSNRTLVAHFQAQTYTITATADPTNGGTVSGGGTYNYGQSCTLTATPVSGYTFLNWTKNGTQVSTNASYTFTVTESATYVAHFQVQSYTITATADPTAGGTVSGGGTYNHGQSCTLTATPATGYNFVNWTKNGTQVSTNTSYTFTVTESAAYVAHFQLQSYTVSVSANPTNGGTVSGGGTYNHGQSCTVSATAASGYSFINWTENGSFVSSNASYTFTVTANRNLVANFTANPLPNYTITVSANPTEGGTVTGGGTYQEGQSCTVSATPNTNYTFINWTENGTAVSTNANYTFTVNGNRTLVANFNYTPQTYTITATADPTDGGTVSGGGTYTQGETCTLTATANEGYTFQRWTKDGTEVSNNPTYSFTVTESATFVAHFSIQTYTITVVADPEEGGTFTGGGTYNYGESYTITAIPNENYTFAHWTEDGVIISDNPTFTGVATSDKTYVAHFVYYDGMAEQDLVTVTLFPNPVKDKLTIEITDPVSMIEIYNTNGALVYRRKDCTETMEISVEDYATGTYMIRLTTENKVVVRRFVKE